MTNKRPILCLLNTGEQCDSCDVCGLFNKRFIQKRNLKDCVYDDYNKQNYNLDMVVVKLNELAEENEQLRQQLKEKEEEEQLYAQEILQLRKTKEEILNFNELGGNY